MFDSLYRMLFMMLIMMSIGYIFYKKNFISESGKKSIANLIIYLILPANVIKAYSIHLGKNVWSDFAEVFIIAIAVQILAMIISKTMLNMMKEGEKQVFQYATICSNAGFMGNPISEGVFGSVGLLYACIFLIPQRIVMWTAGVSYFQRGVSRIEGYKRVAKHPCMIATFLGLIILIFHINLPPLINDSVVALSNCCTGITMIYIGTILADVRFKELLTKKQIYFATIRLLFMPLIVLIGCRLFGVSHLSQGVCTLLTAMPAGSTTSLLATQYHADEHSAAKCVVFTTALSCVSIPIWSILLLSMI